MSTAGRMASRLAGQLPCFFSREVAECCPVRRSLCHSHVQISHDPTEWRSRLEGPKGLFLMFFMDWCWDWGEGVHKMESQLGSRQQDTRAQTG